MGWLLVSDGHSLQSGDNFRCEGFHFRLAGDYLTVTNPSDGTDAPQAVAERYVEALRHAGISISRMAVPEERFSTPPLQQALSVQGLSAAERKRDERSLKLARTELLAGNTTLIRAYEYLQDAVLAVDGDVAMDIDLPLVYKAIEAIENAIGSDGKEKKREKTIRVLGVNYEFATKAANRPEADERHPPKPSDEVASVSMELKDRALGVARDLCAAFADYSFAAAPLDAAAE